MGLMDLDDFLNSLRELIVLLPVVVLIFGPMLVRAMRRRQGAGKGGESKTAAPALPTTPAGRRRKPIPPAPPGGRRPVAFRISREQVLSRETAPLPRPRPPAGAEEKPVSLEEHLREMAEPSIRRMTSSLEARTGDAETAALGPETARAGGGRRRLEALSPLKKAVLWAEILGKPKGW